MESPDNKQRYGKAEAKNMATLSIKCPNCGADSLNPEQLGSSQENDSQKSDSTEKEAVVYTCPSCGAEIVTDETTAASFCFYCQNPVILQGRLNGKYHPDYVIPFALRFLCSTTDRENDRGIFSILAL